jgi:HSP20 family molecular chaperone IbpA
MKNKVIRQNNQPQGRQETEAAREALSFVPRVDIRESEDAVVVLADMPGVDEKTTTIDVERNVLTIRGEFGATPPEGYTLGFQEYETGNYERRFTLSDEIDRDNVEAAVQNGVLRLRLPKAKEAQPRRIAVKAG